ncbi:MAG: DUF11 domain-containing protein [Anaerolineae bacterium]|nr:DUF11 domain-containing protein [Anaerolineae bacterium]
MSRSTLTPARWQGYLRYGLVLLSLLLVSVWASAPERQAAANPAAPQVSPYLWTDVNQAEIILQGERRVIPNRYRTIAINADVLHTILATAPMEFTEAAATNPAEISLPMPDGSMARFHFSESPIMEAELEAKYPEIKSYIGRGADNPTLFTRFGWTYKGFHAVIFTDGPTIYIDPYSTGDKLHYISYSRADYTKILNEPFEQHEPEIEPAIVAEIEAFIANNPEMVIGEQLRTYRLALATTGEYSIYHSAPNPPNVPDVLSELNVAMNRVNGVYEKDTAIRMVLIANNNLIIFLDPATDPYNNSSGSAMLGQNQTTLDNIIGDPNYDIGHVFSTGGGGVAQLGVPCRTGFKARGVTGLPAPVGDPFYIDYVAHEMGHQYGALHTFNGNAGSCAGNRSASAAFEPGSGTTIMAYAGICGAQNIQANSDDHFHTHSIQEIVAYSTGTFGNSCPVITNTGNTPPTANAGTGGFTIPINTPFILTGSATDPNAGDVLTYNWEQYDLGPAGHPNSPTGSAPIFRSFSSVSVPFRVFPRMSDIVNNTQTIGELLPSYTRALNFRLTVRDNNVSPSAGGVHWNLITFQVTDTAGPFVVTNPNTAITWPIGGTAPVTWNVANTNAAPVSCTGVNIGLSTDGGFTYPITLATNVPNNGSHNVVVPNNPTTQARVRVMCANNIFFDISNTNFTIMSVGPFADLDISKTVNPAGPVAPGTPLTYTITVSNAGNITANTTITDTFPAGIVNPVCNSVPGDLNITVGINAASNTVVTCTAQVSSNIGLDIQKTVDRTDVNIGETVTYTIVITNTSATYTLTNVVVSDPNVSGCSPALGTPITLAPLASQTYVCANVVINGTITNTATVTGHFMINNVAYASAPEDAGGPVSDNAETDVVVTASDSVTVTATNRQIFMPVIMRN